MRTVLELAKTLQLDPDANKAAQIENELLQLVKLTPEFINLEEDYKKIKENFHNLENEFKKANPDYAEKLEQFEKDSNEYKAAKTRHAKNTKEYKTLKKAFKEKVIRFEAQEAKYKNGNEAFFQAKTKFAKDTSIYEHKQQRLIQNFKNAYFLRMFERACEHEIENFYTRKDIPAPATKKQDAKDSQLSPTEKKHSDALTAIFTAKDKEYLSPLEYVKNHASLAGEGSLSKVLLNWMATKIKKPTPSDKKHSFTLLSLSSEADRLYKEAYNTYNSTKQAEAITTWLQLVERYSHLNSLKALQKHYNQRGSKGRTKILDYLIELVSTPAQLDAKKQQHNTNNIFLIYWKEKEVISPTYWKNKDIPCPRNWEEFAATLWKNNLSPANWFTFILFTDFPIYETISFSLIRLLREMNIDDVTFYLAFESLPLESRLWYQTKPKLLADLAINYQLEDSSLVAQVASYKDCPLDVIWLVYSFEKHVNAFYQGLTGLAYAAYYNNLPLVNWFYDEKAHLGHIVKFRGSLLHLGALQNIPLAQAMATSISNTASLQRICEEYYKTKGDNPYSSCFEEVAEVLKISDKTKNPNRYRYLECFKVMLHLGWPPSTIKTVTAAGATANYELKNMAKTSDQKAEAYSSPSTIGHLITAVEKALEALRKNNQQKDLHHLCDLFKDCPSEHLKNIISETEVKPVAAIPLTTRPPSLAFFPSHSTGTAPLRGPTGSLPPAQATRSAIASGGPS